MEQITEFLEQPAEPVSASPAVPSEAPQEAPAVPVGEPEENPFADLDPETHDTTDPKFYKEWTRRYQESNAKKNKTIQEKSDRIAQLEAHLSQQGVSGQQQPAPDQAGPDWDSYLDALGYPVESDTSATPSPESPYAPGDDSFVMQELRAIKAQLMRDRVERQARENLATISQNAGVNPQELFTLIAQAGLQATNPAHVALGAYFLKAHQAAQGNAQPTPAPAAPAPTPGVTPQGVQRPVVNEPVLTDEDGNVLSIAAIHDKNYR